MPRYLFGPVTSAFAKDYLKPFQDSGDCLAFDTEGRVDLTIGHQDTWEQVRERFPQGWSPDFIVVSLAYSSVPSCVWNAPIPVIAIAWDWHLLWHYYRRQLRFCEWVLTDPQGVGILAKEGIKQAHALPWLGLANDLKVVESGPSSARDFDVLFADNLNPAIFPERLPTLGRLANLGKRWRVAIRPGTDTQANYLFYKRSRVVVHLPSAGTTMQPLLDATAAGALVFCEKSKRELPAPFEDGKNCVLFDADSLETQLERYLDDEAGCSRLVRATQKSIESCRFQTVWSDAVAEITQNLAKLKKKVAQRPLAPDREALRTRTWQALGAAYSDDIYLVRDLENALREGPATSSLANALGMALSRAVAGTVPVPVMAEAAAEQFRRAVELDSRNVLAGLNLAESLAAFGKKKEAVEQAKRALATLERMSDLDGGALDDGHFEPGFGSFRVEWERAGWMHPGQPDAERQVKRSLLLWQLERFLGNQTRETPHIYQAHLARPHQMASEAALGAHLVQSGYLLEGLPHLRQGLKQNPFDGELSRLSYQVMGLLGDTGGRHALAAERRQFFRAGPQIVSPEPWYFEAPPSAEECVSIILLCFNELAYTRHCIESILRHTKSRYELILVDNGSTDGTLEYLQSLAKAPGPERVIVLHNEENQGYPAGCNQGAQAAKGQFLLFLNNDTVVTSGWLEGMVGWLVRDWPRAGLVGATSNNVPAPQSVRCNYSSLEEIEQFAERRRQKFAGRCLRVRRISGFCLLMRRDLFQQLGGMDERFGMGYMEDDDLGLRVQDAGFQLLIALDVFVHHYGSRTATAAGFDVLSMIEKNLTLFRDKWGNEYADHLTLPPRDPKAQDAPESLAKKSIPPAMSGALLPAKSAKAPEPEVSELAPVARTPRVSLSMIVRNEEKNLPDCLASVQGVFDEIVVVDTGSSDNTREIAKQYGARVFEFPWIDSFSAARNESLKQCTGKWVVWLDADDRLDEENRQRLKKVFERLEDGLDCYSMKVRSLVNKANDTHQSLDQVRLFPNHPEAKWDYRIHEQIFPSLRRLGAGILPTDVVINHTGYQEQSARRSKLERNIRLIHLDHEDRPKDPFNLFYLGWTTMDLGKAQEGIPFLEQSLQYVGPDSSLGRKLYGLIAQANRKLNRRGESLRWCEEGLRKYPDDVELLFEKGMLCWEKKDWPTVEQSLKRVLTTRSVSYYASLEEGLRGYRTRHLLGLLYHDQQRWSEAEIQWRAVVSERPRFMAAWQGLGRLFLHERRWADLDVVVQMLLKENLVLDAALFRAKSALSRKEFGSARQLADEIITRFPHALEARVLLSHVLLQEGRDPHATETALRDVLRLAPNHQGARHNLKLFLREQGRLTEA